MRQQNQNHVDFQQLKTLLDGFQKKCMMCELKQQIRLINMLSFTVSTQGVTTGSLNALDWSDNALVSAVQSEDDDVCDSAVSQSQGRIFSLWPITAHVEVHLRDTSPHWEDGEQDSFQHLELSSNRSAPDGKTMADTHTQTENIYVALYVG